MSDSELSDIEGLQELINEYSSENPENKPKENEVKDEKKPPAIKIEKTNVEVPMDKVLFGDKKSLIENLAKNVNEKKSDSEDDDEGEEKKASKRKPAWVDDDDEEIRLGQIKKATRFTGSLSYLNKDKKYKDYLTDNFKKIVAEPKWASLDHKPEKDSDDDDDELLRSVGFIGKRPVDVLSSHVISIRRLKDLNRSTYLEKHTTSINFHQTSTAAMVTGENGYASIYSIDGSKNENLHTMRFKDFPIICAKIYPCGTKAIFGSIRSSYYKYDLLTAQETLCHMPRYLNSSCKRLEVSPCGRYIAVAGRLGDVHLLTANSNEIIYTFKQPNLAPLDLCFTEDSQKLICNDYSSNITIFSLKQRRLEHSFIDEGCIQGKVLRLSPNQRMLATGSNEGVVNVYDFEAVQKTKTPLPIKRFLNLTTSITDLNFNHSSEILAFCSSLVKDGVKLAHFPSGTVYANFPNNTSKLGEVTRVQFSPNSGFLAFGTSKKEIPLCRVKHFKNY